MAQTQSHQDRWTSVYQACRLEQEGLALDKFLEAPWLWLEHYGQEAALRSIAQGFRPLLPAQVKVARRVGADTASQQRGTVIPFKRK